MLTIGKSRLYTGYRCGITIADRGGEDGREIANSELAKNNITFL